MTDQDRTESVPEGEAAVGTKVTIDLPANDVYHEVYGGETGTVVKYDSVGDAQYYYRVQFEDGLSLWYAYKELKRA